MVFLSLGQAAKHSGKSKSTISKALKSGKLSYISKGKNGYKIDPSELHRVYPYVVGINVQNEQVETSNETALLREMLEREREIVKDLQERLSKSEEIREEQRLRLEHMSTRKRFLGIF